MRNQKTTVSWIYFGKIIEKNYHFMNYTAEDFRIAVVTGVNDADNSTITTDKNDTLYAFPAYDVRIGNFSLDATRAALQNIKTIIDV